MTRGTISEEHAASEIQNLFARVASGDRLGDWFVNAETDSDLTIEFAMRRDYLTRGVISTLERSGPEAQGFWHGIYSTLGKSDSAVASALDKTISEIARYTNVLTDNGRISLQEIRDYNPTVLTDMMTTLQVLTEAYGADTMIVNSLVDFDSWIASEHGRMLLSGNEDSIKNASLSVKLLKDYSNVAVFMQQIGDNPMSQAELNTLEYLYMLEANKSYIHKFIAAEIQHQIADGENKPQSHLLDILSDLSYPGGYARKEQRVQEVFEPSGIIIDNVLATVMNGANVTTESGLRTRLGTANVNYARAQALSNNRNREIIKELDNATRNAADPKAAEHMVENIHMLWQNPIGTNDRDMVPAMIVQSAEWTKELIDKGRDNAIGSVAFGALSTSIGEGMTSVSSQLTNRTADTMTIGEFWKDKRAVARVLSTGRDLDGNVVEQEVILDDGRRETLTRQRIYEWAGAGTVGPDSTPTWSQMRMLLEKNPALVTWIPQTQYTPMVLNGSVVAQNRQVKNIFDSLEDAKTLVGNGTELNRRRIKSAVSQNLSNLAGYYPIVSFAIRDIEQGFITPGLLSKRALDAHDKIVDTTIKLAALSIEDKVKAKEWLRNNILSEANAEIARLLSTMREVTARMRIGTDEIAANQMNAALRSFFMREDLRNPEVNVDSFIKDSIAGFELAFLAQRVMGINSMDMMFSDLRARIGEENLTDSQILERLHIQDFVKSQTNVIIEASDTPEQMKQKIRDILDRGYYTRAPENAYDLASRAIDEAEDLAPIRAKWNSILFEYHINRAMNNYTVMVQNNPVPLDTAYDIYSYWEYAIDMVQDEVAGLQLNWDSYRDPFSQVKFPNLYLGNRNNLNLAEASKASAVSAGIAIRVGLEGAAFKDFGGLLTLDHTRSLQPPSQSQVTINDIKSARWDNNLTQYEGWRATASDGTTFIINETTLEQRADDEQVTLSSPEYSSFGDIINPAVQNVYNTASEAGILQAKKYFDPFKLIAKGIENKQANNRDITADPINGIMHARKDIAMAYVDFWNQYEGVSQKTRRDADALALLSTLLVKVEMNNHPPVAVSYEIVFRGELDQHIKDLYDGDQVTKISTMVEPVAVVTRRLESAFIKAIDSGAKQADAFKAANDALTDGSGIVFNTDEGVNDIIMGIESVAKPTMSTLMTEGQPNKFQRFFASVNEGYHEQLASVRREIATDLNQQQQERMAQVASMLGIPGVRISAVFSDRDPNMGDADVVRELNDISKNYPKNKRNGVGSVALVWTDNASTFFDNVENRKAIGDQNVLVIEHNGSLRGEDYFSHAAFVSNMEEARFPMTLWDPVQAQLQQEYYNLVQTQRNIPQSSEEYGAFFIEENAAFFARGDSSSFFTEDFGKRNYITQDFSQSIDLKLNRNWGRGVPSLVSLEELINMDRSVIQLPMISEGTEWAEPLDTEDKRNAARESLEVWVKDAMKDMSTIKNRPAFNTSMARGNVLGVLRYPQNVDTDQPVYVALVPTTGVTTYSVDVQDVQIVNGEQVEITAYHTDNLWNFGHIKMTDGQIKTYTGALENEYADGLPQPENLVTSGVVAPDLGKPARVFSYNILAENLWGASRIYPCSALLEWDGSKWMLKNDLYQRLVATNLFTEEEIAKFPEGNTTQNKVWREYKAGRLQLFGTDTDRAMRSLILRCEQNRVNITEIISPVVMQAGEPRSNRTAPEMGAVILKSMNEDDLKLIYETLMPNWAKYFGKNGEVPLRGGSGEFGRFRITRWSELSETNELTINPSGQRAHAFQREIMMGLVTHPSHLSDRMINHFRDHINTPSYQAVDTSVPLKVDPDNPILTRDVTRELAAYMADPLYAGKMAAAREYVGDIRRKWYQHYNIMDGERTVDTNKLQGLTNMMNEAFEFTTPITTEQMLNHFVKPEDGWSPFDSKQATMPWPRLDMIVKGLISRLNTDGSPLFSASVYENGNQKRFSIPFTTAKGLQLLETSPVFRQKYTNKQTGKYDVELFKNDIRQNFELFKDNINHNVQDRKQNETLIKMVDFYDSELNIGLGNMLIGLTDPVSMFAQEDTFHATLAPQFPFMDIKQLQDLNEEAHQRMLRHNKAVMDKDRIWLESSVKRTGKSSMAKQGKHTMANKAFQTLGDMTQIAGLAQGLQLPISNLVSRRLGTFGLDVMHQLSSKTGIGPKQYGKDLNPQIARDISRTAIIQKIIWLKKQSSFLAVDLAQLLNEVTTIEELNARIDEIVRGMSPAQKILYKVGNYANFGNMGTSWQAEIFLKQFAKNLSIDPVLGPMYNYQMPDINGEPNVEGYTFLEASLMASG